MIGKKHGFGKQRKNSLRPWLGVKTSLKWGKWETKKSLKSHVGVL